MFFHNLLLEITCPKCGKQLKETLRWLNEATNRTHERLQNLQDSLESIKIKL
jgi:transcription initiation factor IIE alpha subunit